MAGGGRGRWIAPVRRWRANPPACRPGSAAAATHAAPARRRLHRLPVPPRGHRGPRRAPAHPARRAAGRQGRRIQPRQPRRHAGGHRLDRHPGPTPGVDLWWSGKHHHHGRNLQVISAPDGRPLWTSPVRPGREHGTTCIRHHQALPVIDQAADQLPTMADLGYEGDATTLRIPIKKPARGRLSDNQKTKRSSCHTTSTTAPHDQLPNATTSYREWLSAPPVSAPPARVFGESVPSFPLAEGHFRLSARRRTGSFGDRRASPSSMTEDHFIGHLG